MQDAERGQVEARIGSAGGPELLARLRQLDALGPVRPAPPLAPGPGPGSVDFDVILVGGGLSLLVAAPLAARGLRVAICERGRAAQAQREWNASWPELQALPALGLVSEAELNALVLNRYRHGICRWHGGGTHRVYGVLDCAVDATALLALARQRASAAGVTFFEGQAAEAVGADAYGVRLQLGPAADAQVLTARLLLDGRGAASPYARADIICPTVGGVLTGLSEGTDVDCVDPGVGEILATTEHVEAGHQHIWEAFPGRPGQTTVYLFYYAQRRHLAPGALLELYARFFARLSQYKSGPAQLLRPTFGHIPGWSRLAPAPRAPHRRIILMGDAAARHSPLTFCGFGAMLRALGPLVTDVVAELGGDAGRHPPRRLQLEDAPLHGATGALALVMTRPQAAGQVGALNGLLDVAFATLARQGNGPFAALLQDRMDLPDFLRFLLATSRRQPGVYRLIWRCLGPWACLRWSALLVIRLLTGGWRRRRAAPL